MTNPVPNRRQFFGASAAFSSLAFGASTLMGDELNVAANATQSSSKQFNLSYAPDPGMFKKSAGSDVLDQIRFMADKGYTGVIGMEHGNSKKGIEGERKVIEAYRKADQF